MSAQAATPASSYSKGLILAVLVDRNELSLRELVLCFVSCKAFKELLDGRGFCIGTAWLCAYLESGQRPADILSRLRRARGSLSYERPLSRADQVTSFLMRHEDYQAPSAWVWAQLLYQEPDGGVLCEGVKKMRWMLKHGLVKQLHKATGYCPGLCTLKGHSTNNPECTCNHGFLGITYAANPECPVEGHSGWVLSVAFSPCGKFVASSGDRTVKIWDAQTGKEKCSLPGWGHSNDNPECTCDHSWRYVANPECPVTGHSNVVTSVAWSPDGKQFATGSHDCTIKIWDAQTGQEKCSLTGHSDYVTSVAWSPDGKLVASGSGDKTIRFWDVATGKEVMGPLTGHSNPVIYVAWSPDSKLVASGSRDKTTRIWDVAMGKEAMGPLKGHSSHVNSAAWSPDGKLVASGSDDSTIRIWDVATGKEVMGRLWGTMASWQNLDPHTKELAAKVQKADSTRSIMGHCIVTANGDMVRVYLTNSDEWQEQREPLACFRCPATVTAVSCTGTSVVVGCRDGQVLFLEAPLLSA